MKRKIGIKELHLMATQMKYYDFENYLAKELYDQPDTINTTELTNKLYLDDGSLSVKNIAICNAHKDLKCEYRERDRCNLRGKCALKLKYKI